MQIRQVIAFTVIAVIALLVGTALGYSVSSGKTTTLRQSVTDTTSAMIFQSTTVTSISTISLPKFVTINGTVETQFYMPVEVAFRVCYYGNLSGILGSEFCGNQNYTSPVTNIKSWNISANFAGTSTTMFNGTYSVQIPNNATYDVYLVITDPHETPITYEKVDVVRLPVYSDVQNISNYDIGCLYEGAGNSFYYCISA